MYRRRAANDEGAVAVLVAVLMVALLGFAAIVVDAGAVYAQRRQMQTAADAAALAGVQELPFDPAGAQAAADQYTTLNASNADQRDFTVSSTFVANDTLLAEVQDTAMGLFFARAVGIDSTPVGARATAVVGSPRVYGEGVMPFGIIATGTVSPPYGYSPGDWIDLIHKDDKNSGNWGFVDFKDYSSANQTKGIVSGGGTSKPLAIGAVVDTQPGAALNPIFGALNGYFACPPHGTEALVYDDSTGIYEAKHALDGSDCHRLITCPIIVIAEAGMDPFDAAGLTGKSVSVRIIGFVNMFVANDPNHNDGILTAKFVQVVPHNVMQPGGYIPYGGVMYWLER